MNRSAKRQRHDQARKQHKREMMQHAREVAKTPKSNLPRMMLIGAVTVVIMFVLIVAFGT